MWGKAEGRTAGAQPPQRQQTAEAPAAVFTEGHDPRVPDLPLKPKLHRHLSPSQPTSL